jgi:hypothetical protein
LNLHIFETYLILSSVCTYVSSHDVFRRTFSSTKRTDLQYQEFQTHLPSNICNYHVGPSMYVKFGDATLFSVISYKFVAASLNSYWPGNRYMYIELPSLLPYVIECARYYVMLLYSMGYCVSAYSMQWAVKRKGLELHKKFCSSPG